MRIARSGFSGVDMAGTAWVRNGFLAVMAAPVCGQPEANAKMKEMEDLLMRKALLFGIITVLLILVCVVCVLLIRRWRRNRRDSAAEAVSQSAGVEDITLDLTEQMQELREYADEVRTLVDIGYYSETEVIE